MSRVQTNDVAFEYPGGVRALAGVSLAIEAGESVAIVGQNGSGKSTLVRHFNGLLRPTSGTVTIADLDSRQARIAQLAHHVALAFQDPDRQIFGGSVESEASFGARNLGLRGAELEESVARALESVGLLEQRKANPYDLGYTRRKLLTIASVIAMGTPVVVLDEPTTGQDARGVATVERIVAGLTEAGRTVVCISHDMRFVAESFTRVIVMREGRVILDGTPADVFGEASWEQLRSTNLQPPYAARVGIALGLGSTPTQESVVSALIERR